MTPAPPWRKAARGASILRYLREPLDARLVGDRVRARLRERDRSFLELIRNAVFDNPRSPHLALLRWAGWDYERLRSSVESQGVEQTLVALRDAGVRTGVSEFKARAPIVREGLELRPRAVDFANPWLTGSVIRGRSSGRSGPAIFLSYGSEMLTEEAELEALLFEAHGVEAVPHAIWLPALPGIAGIHNLLVHMKFRRPPERWFSQTGVRLRDRPVYRYLSTVGRAFGVRAPVPSLTRLDQAVRVAEWLRAARRRAGAAVLKTYASSAVRVAAAARENGIDLTGCLIFSGGEPLTPSRRTYIEESGASVFSRYVATECGWVAGACPSSGSPDTMHLYSDRVAAVSDGGPAGAGSPLLLTTLTPSAGRVLLNTDLGDCGELHSIGCDCPLQGAGLDIGVSSVRSHRKVVAEGMTVLTDTAIEVLEEVLREVGGEPDSFDLREEEAERGERRLVIRLDPSVELVAGDDWLIESMLERLSGRGPAEKLAAEFWRESDGVELRREPPPRQAGKVPATPGGQ